MRAAPAGCPGGQGFRAYRRNSLCRGDARKICRFCCGSNHGKIKKKGVSPVRSILFLWRSFTRCRAFSPLSVQELHTHADHPRAYVDAQAAAQLCLQHELPVRQPGQKRLADGGGVPHAHLAAAD